MKTPEVIEAVAKAIHKRCAPCCGSGCDTRILRAKDAITTYEQATAPKWSDAITRAWVEAAKCPACDGKGAIPQEGSMPSGETDSMGYEIPIACTDWTQCQWCAEKASLIATPPEGS